MKDSASSAGKAPAKVPFTFSLIRTFFRAREALERQRQKPDWIISLWKKQAHLSDPMAGTVPDELPKRPTRQAEPDRHCNTVGEGLPHQGGPRIHGGEIDLADPVILATRRSHAFSDLSRALESDGGLVIRVTSFPVAVDLLLLKKHRFSFFLCDLDSFGGIGNTFEGLRSLRENLSDLPILLFSGDFARDDFETTRLALCDVCLSGQVSFVRLEMGLCAAVRNNLIWQKRRLEIGKLGSVNEQSAEDRPALLLKDSGPAMQMEVL